jgi:hypothetical protein
MTVAAAAAFQAAVLQNPRHVRVERSHVRDRLLLRRAGGLMGVGDRQRRKDRSVVAWRASAAARSTVAIAAAAAFKAAVHCNPSRVRVD